jgi:guanosine-3',5'-bis(diphosphate) 3'-pyrophosphohydrolase
VAHIVEGVTKIDKIQFANREDRQAENVRKMLLAMVSDVRVVLIKLADRLHNMRTLEHLKPDRQEAIARETQEIYAPLAHRLGMGKVRGELEDLAFRYTDPVSYEQVSAAVEARRVEGEQFLRSVEDTLVEQLRENNIEARVEWRIKRLYSIYQKIERSKVSFDQVYDLLAVRVITQDVAACYAVFGLIHTLWRPVPGRIKDFHRHSARQPLPVAAHHGDGRRRPPVRGADPHRRDAPHRRGRHCGALEVQGRRLGVGDGARRRAAELDPAAGRVAEGDDRPQRIPLQPEDGPLSRRGLHLHAQGEGGGGSRRTHAGGLCLHIHTEVGHTCVGAKVNGRMVPLRTKLRTGDIVEIVTQKDHKPSRDWLTFVKSPRARNKIKHWLNEDQRRARSGDRPQAAGARGAQVQGADEPDRRPGPGPHCQRVRRGHGRRSAGDAGPGQALRAPGAEQAGAGICQPGDGRRAFPRPSRAGGEAGMSDAVRKLHFTGSDSLQVEGQNDLLVYRARCCNPIRGEEIVGYVTRGKGVAVHARSCPNVQNLLYESDRRIAVEWSRVGDQAAGIGRSAIRSRSPSSATTAPAC